VATAFKNLNKVKTSIETIVIPTMSRLKDLPAISTASQKRHWDKGIEVIRKKGIICSGKHDI